jgi:succinate dehydrogenase/fumarate reductase cytochrome b subunit
MFVWVFHRVSGLLLIVLLSLKFFTSFFMMTKDKKPDWAIVLHANPLTDTLLIVLVVFHGLYGVRTILMDLGARREKLLFWVFTILAVVLSAALLVVYYTRNY